MRALLIVLAAGCAGHHGMGTSTVPTAPTGTEWYGSELLVEDLGFIAAGDTIAYTSDRVHASDGKVRWALSAWAFGWAVTDAAIHLAHGNPLGAIAGPAAKLALPYALGSRLSEGHWRVGVVLWIACMLIDDVVIARARSEDAPAMMQLGGRF